MKQKGLKIPKTKMNVLKPFILLLKTAYSKKILNQFWKIAALESQNIINGENVQDVTFAFFNQRMIG